MVLVQSESDRVSSSTSVQFIVHGHSKKKGFETVIINNNPETVSTDFDIADKLFTLSHLQQKMLNQS